MHTDVVDVPDYLRDFLFYMEVVKGRSSRTVNAYYIDLRTFLRYLKQQKLQADKSIDFEDITIADVPIEVIRAVTLNDVYAYLHYVTNERENNAKTRARKVSALKTFFRYLSTKTTLLSHNPVLELELPSLKKSLPRYLTLEQSLELLNVAASSENPEYAARDYCILTFFLNCGMRLSELVGIDISDVNGSEGALRGLGKGNKERIVYLNDACMRAYNDYLKVRPQDRKGTRALFLSRNGNRISRRRVQEIVEQALARCGLSGEGFSTHKLRHTAATLMYQHGHVDIRLLKEILGHENLSTTEIYTHVSSEQMKKAALSSPLANVKKTRKSGK